MNSKSIKQIFNEFFPNKQFDYNVRLKYSAKFSDYNANIRLYKDNLTINLSKKWKGVNKEIVKGLIQVLLIKMFANTGQYKENKKKLLERGLLLYLNWQKKSFLHNLLYLIVM